MIRFLNAALRPSYERAASTTAGGSAAPPPALSPRVPLVLAGMTLAQCAACPHGATMRSGVKAGGSGDCHR